MMSAMLSRAGTRGGCVNLTPDDAKWLYGWTLPAVPVEVTFVRDNGTKLVVL